ncbi:hypothetical protein [Mycoplasma bradburyae]|uniref:Uncharacterized protein n=1 Tax=Mycoplasma bradburyae TaxID=2963128 RepID=A0AAW6HNY2_9MOLU|nr:hypothetical protein [Mycoplasma bradburyae]MDC4163407.1 hypothetical protein [Mycoplasma bradburyae]MDC4182023.1 hypothetical protein [Mycoplasma bradburyae]MDC4182721.1 hypothetical protein [Mycoplasma bradburyae]MDC4183394.1 hypothetical protein [Mycoplasma bradburyae]MDC4184205.1 hypothetical protein [Mycoplasma bradburyae]
MLEKLAQILKLSKEELKERLNVTDDVSESDLLKALGFDKYAAIGELLNISKFTGQIPDSIDTLNIANLGEVFQKVNEALFGDGQSEEHSKKFSEFMENMDTFISTFGNGFSMYNSEEKPKEEDDDEVKVTSLKNKKDFS